MSYGSSRTSLNTEWETMIQNKRPTIETASHTTVGAGVKGSGKLWPLHSVGSVGQKGWMCFKVKRNGTRVHLVQWFSTVIML